MSTPIKQLIKELNDREEFPRAAIEQLLARPAESTPALLELIQDPVEAYTTSLDDLEDAGLWGMFLLAHFREPKAFPLLVQLLEYPHEDFDDFWGDLGLEIVGRFLASTYNGDFAALRSLAHNTDVHYIACSCAIEAIGLLYYHGHISRAALLDELQQLKQLHCSDVNMQGVIFVTIVSIVYDYQIEELRPWLEKEATTKEMNIFDHEDLDKRFALSPEELQEVLKDDPHHSLITDPIDLIEFWWNNCNSPEDSEWDEPEIPEPYQRESPKVGRNDPCPCGSGKKYKKCCG